MHSDARPAIGFRVVTTHRFSHPDAPEGLLYLGEDLETCLWECYGDEILDPGARISRNRWYHSRLSQVRSKESLSICDLADPKTRRCLSVDLTALNYPDLSVPQQWRLAIQTHPAAVDGLRFPSRFTAQPCLVLFDRDNVRSMLTSRPSDLLPACDEASNFLTENMIHLA